MTQGNNDLEYEEEREGGVAVATRQHDTEIELFGADGNFQQRVEIMKQRIGAMKQFVASCMTENEDYGVIPGTEKKTLLKPGAEKLLQLYRYNASFPILKQIRTDTESYYQVKCVISDMNGAVVGEGIGSCSSLERKYRNQKTSRDVFLNKATEEEKAAGKMVERTSSRTGKPYKVIELVGDILPQDFDNTVLKMAQKRAMVAATLLVTRLSADFTQDIEDDPGLYGLGGNNAGSNKPEPEPEPENKGAGKSSDRGKSTSAKKEDKPEPEKADNQGGVTPDSVQAAIIEEFENRLKDVRTNDALDELKADMKGKLDSLTGMYRDAMIKKGGRMRDMIKLVDNGDKTWDELEQSGVI